MTTMTGGTPLDVPRGLAGVVVTDTALGDVRGREGFYHYRQYSAVELAESRGFEALFLNGLVGEDQLNHALGISTLASQTELLSVFSTDFVPIPASSGVTLTELTAALGTSAFDTDLTSIANADYALAASDFEGYLTSLAGDTSALGDIGTLLTDLSNSFSDLGTNLTTDFSAVITDITALLGGGLI